MHTACSIALPTNFIIHQSLHYQLISDSKKYHAQHYHSLIPLGNRSKCYLQMSPQVSWVRHRDVHLLTVGRYTYTSDQRFRAIHQPHSEDWTLQIKYPQHRDSGVYECQVSSTPHLSHFIHLTVIGKFILNYNNLYRLSREYSKSGLKKKKNQKPASFNAITYIHVWFN